MKLHEALTKIQSFANVPDRKITLEVIETAPNVFQYGILVVDKEEQE